MEKKEQYKQRAIYDIIQLNEEAEIKLLLKTNKYNERNLQNTEKMINDVSVKIQYWKCFQNLNKTN